MEVFNSQTRNSWSRGVERVTLKYATSNKCLQFTYPDTAITYKTNVLIHLADRFEASAIAAPLYHRVLPSAVKSTPEACIDTRCAPCWQLRV